MAGCLAFALYPPLVSHDMFMNNQLQRKNYLVKYWFVTQKENNKNQYNFFYSTQNNHCWSTGVILIVRPLLSINRFQITILSSRWGLPLQPDKSNQNTHFSRNRIRKQILPALRLFFNPQTDYAIYQFIEITSVEEQYLSFLTNRLLNVIMANNQKWLILNTYLIARLPLPLTRRVVKLFLEKVVPRLDMGTTQAQSYFVVETKQIRSYHIEHLLKMYKNRTKMIDSYRIKSNSSIFVHGRKTDNHNLHVVLHMPNNCIYCNILNMAQIDHSRIMAHFLCVCCFWEGIRLCRTTRFQSTCYQSTTLEILCTAITFLCQASTRNMYENKKSNQLFGTHFFKQYRTVKFNHILPTSRLLGSMVFLICKTRNLNNFPIYGQSKNQFLTRRNNSKTFLTFSAHKKSPLKMIFLPKKGFLFVIP